MGNLCVIQRRFYGRFWRNHLPRFFSLFLFLSFFSSPVIAEAVDNDLEQDLQKSLARSKILVAQINTKAAQGASVTSELTQLKVAAENIKAANLLLEERFKLRGEKVKALSAKAVERHQAMVGGYRKALIDYLTLIDNLPSDGTISQSSIRNLHSLLEKILPKKKRPIIGSLPYKHLNYPSQQPTSASPITPAYLGGNKTVSPDDTAAAPEAPISTEIAALAQSLNWSPVSIYEYVKNNIETEWYWGCQKSAEETLHQKSGNDCDQAALLAALLRASGFPTRYVRGVIQFFPDIDRAKNLTGIDDPMKIAEFFQKAGIPYTPVIAGGTISNIQIEHVWVESQIPYSNYRGVVIDANGKAWLGLDTSIKVKGYTYKNAKDIFQEPGVSSQLSGIRDEYLSSQPTSTQPATPLEYLQSFINTQLATSQPGTSYSDYLLTRTLVPEILNILPASMQFTLIKATNEYIAIPDELIHKARFLATRDAQLATPLFDITLPLYKLSNQQIAVSYEPETVQDQEIIDSYGGLDNTPAYLVRLRPVLTINKERIVVAQDGLPMGADYDLNIELRAPGDESRVEKTTNAMIAGNLTVIGIVAQRAVSTQQSTDSSQPNAESPKDAERLLYESAQHYIDRWNKAENELASLLHLGIARPIPTVVTIGGVFDVVSFMGMPYTFTWRGEYIDADERAIETVASDELKTKTFVQLSSLQGSVLEHRVFEDDFQVPSISTAKLLQIANTQPILAIDQNNIATVLPTLTLDQNIQDDIANAVNQNYTIRIPQAKITYLDWTGTGYVKEDSDTGQSGWMLSGMIAGGMTAVSSNKWSSPYIETILGNPYNGESRNIYITSPKNESTVSTSAIIVSGVILDPDAVVTINDVQAEIQGTTFTAPITLASGNNTITATAVNKAGKTTFDMIVIRYKIPVMIAITYPFDNAELSVSPIYVEGFISDPAASVYVNGTKVTPSPDNRFIANNITLTEGQNQIIASAMNSDGDLDSQTITINYHVTQPQPSLTVAITSPANGATINKPSATVVGTVTSTAGEVWVTVNGMPATIYGNQFVVNNVQLINGSNRIIVNAMDSSGAIARTEIAVSANATTPYVQLGANVTDGTAPLNTYFTINTNTTGTVAGYQLDFGDGSTSYSGTSFDDVSHNYMGSGIFRPVITITDSLGNVYTDTIALVLLDKAKLNAVLTSKWNGMKGKLANQDVDGAVGYFSTGSKGRYREIFTALRSDLPKIVQDMQNIEMIYAAHNAAKYRIRANEVYSGSNLEVTYYIYFEVSEFGVWQIRLF